MNELCASALEIMIERETIQQLVTKLLQRKGMFAAEAEIVAERMIEADLDLRPSEGARTLPQYLEAMDLGDIDPRARMITVQETPSMAILDGSSGIGHVAVTRAMEMAIDKAKASGVGTVVVKNSRPAGDLGGFARLASRTGMIGLVTTSFNEDSSSVDSHDIAWSIPAPDGLTSILYRQDRKSLGASWLLLCGILPAGLAGADLAGHKRKVARAANVVEYCLIAFDPSHFGLPAELLEKWSVIRSTEVAQPPVNTNAQESTTIKYSADDAELLSQLATKIKFPKTW